MTRRVAIGTDSSLAHARVLLDCRWLGIGGAGRVTELLLDGLRSLEPPGRWTLWGGPRVPDWSWSGARVHETEVGPTELAGQRELLAVPAHDLALYMHQIRPFRPGRAVTMIYDTIPLRFGARGQRALRRAFFVAVARLSSHILTVSEFSKRRIVEDLRVPETRVTMLRLPPDRRFVDQVERLRAEREPADLVLYVGRFAAHKNLKRLILAFGRTRAIRSGTELLLVGGDPGEVERLRAFAGRHGVDRVRVSGPISDASLAELYATVRLLVMPSLEEGFGLPAWEAISVGLPVALSEGGALRELAEGHTEPFSPTSITAIAEAIDRGLAQSRGTPGSDPSVPTTVSLAREVIEVLERVAAR